MSNYYHYNVGCGGIMKEEMTVCSEEGKGCGVGLFTCAQRMVSAYFFYDIPVSVNKRKTYIDLLNW